MTDDIKNTPAPNPFDPANLMVTGDTHTIGAKQVLTRIRVRKPNKQEFFRVRQDSDFKMIGAILEMKEDREFYLVQPAAIGILMEDIRYVEILVCQNRQGETFIWPLPVPASDGRTNSWYQSARDAAELAENGWIRMLANMSGGAYTIYEATGLIPDPHWPKKTMGELLELAFKDGRLIDSEDHPIIQQLRGA